MIRSRQTASNAPVEMSATHPGIKITSANNEPQRSSRIGQTRDRPSTTGPESYTRNSRFEAQANDISERTTNFRQSTTRESKIKTSQNVVKSSEQKSSAVRLGCPDMTIFLEQSSYIVKLLVGLYSEHPELGSQRQNLLQDNQKLEQVLHPQSKDNQTNRHRLRKRNATFLRKLVKRS